MTAKERFIAALERRTPDRLPVTTHHVMSSYLDKYLPGVSIQGFFDHFELDPIVWTVPHRPDTPGTYADPLQGEPGFLESKRVASDQWRIYFEQIPDPDYTTTRYRIATPSGELTTVLQGNQHTVWVTEHLIKEKRDIEIIGEWVTSPACDVQAVNETARRFGRRGMVRGHICGFDIFGQPGCWQDACCLVGTERLIMETYDDPGWVKELLQILLERKLHFTRTLAGARYDLLELGGGDASTTVISPAIFNEFVAPYDVQIIETAHAAGQRIVYHTCGGMMPILEDIAAMRPDAMETFTPPAMGADVDLAQAKRRIGDRVCMIGGFDQGHYFTGCTPEQTRRAVRDCFEAAGAGGGYILAPSDHFFDAEEALLRAFSEEARACRY